MTISYRQEQMTTQYGRTGSGHARLLTRALAAGVLVLCLSRAFTGTAIADDEAEGKRRFEAGQKYFNQGQYLDAAKEFEAGYAAAPRSAFLLNIGHCYRLAGELEKAKANYELLLELEPHFPKRAEVEAHIADIDAQLAALAAAFAPPKDESSPPSAQLATKPEPIKSVVLDTQVQPGRAGGVMKSTVPARAEPVDVAGAENPGAVTNDVFEYRRPDVLVLRTEDIPENKKDDQTVFSSPWIWVGTLIVLGAIVGGVVLLMGNEKEPCPATVCLKE